ncbi:hypothetical protein Fmac_008275 [Flemingia macrophylla]|uniref:Uncharacterized protein n=1 Tax=Flemingia macrophylla TaxID=520843 RepID=A0ABD1MWW8_9FABA
MHDDFGRARTATFEENATLVLIENHDGFDHTILKGKKRSRRSARQLPRGLLLARMTLLPPDIEVSWRGGCLAPFSLLLKAHLSSFPISGKPICVFITETCVAM